MKIQDKGIGWSRLTGSVLMIIVWFVRWPAERITGGDTGAGNIYGEYLWRILHLCVGIPVQNVSLLLETSDELNVVSMTYLKL